MAIWAGQGFDGDDSGGIYLCCCYLVEQQQRKQGSGEGGCMIRGSVFCCCHGDEQQQKWGWRCDRTEPGAAALPDGARCGRVRPVGLGLFFARKINFTAF